MSFIVGNGTTVQVGKEAAFGTKVAMTELVNLTSESLKVSVEKGEEGSLLASKTAQTKDLLAINVDGSLSFILKPEFAGRLFQSAFGGEDVVGDGTSGYKTHTINLCGVNDELPSLTFTVDRKVAVKAYTGCTISSLSIDAAAGDYVKGSIDIKGHKEEEGVLAELPGFTLPSYRCTEATFTVDGHNLCISNASFKLDNGIEDAPKTYCTGLYKGQPQHGTRVATMDIEVPYSSEIEAFKDTNLITEKTASVDLKFTSRDANYNIEIKIPNLAITDMSANVGGTGLVNASISGTALSVGSTEPVTVIIQDKTEEAYSL